MKRILILLTLVFLLVGCQKPTVSASPTPTPAPTLNMENILEFVDSSQTGTLVEDWNHTYRVIAHAMGGIEEHDYTNSLDAFVENYNQGSRLFEFDLEHCSDGTLVLAHTWEDFRTMIPDDSSDDPYAPMTLEEFQNAKIYGQYTTMTFHDLCALMEEIPDFYVIVDSKTFDVDSTQTIYQEMIDEVQQVNPALLQRFIPQAYTPEIYDAIKAFGFDQIIFTLYSYYVDSNGQDIYAFVKDRQVPVVVMHMDNDWAVKVITDIYAYAQMEGKENDFTIYIHTVNDMETAEKIVNEYHFFGVYSDFITEKKMEEAL